MRDFINNIKDKIKAIWILFAISILGLTVTFAFILHKISDYELKRIILNQKKKVEELNSSLLIITDDLGWDLKKITSDYYINKTVLNRENSFEIMKNELINLLKSKGYYDYALVIDSNRNIILKIIYFSGHIYVVKLNRIGSIKENVSDNRLLNGKKSVKFLTLLENNENNNLYLMLGVSPERLIKFLETKRKVELPSDFYIISNGEFIYKRITNIDGSLNYEDLSSLSKKWGNITFDNRRYTLEHLKNKSGLCTYSELKIFDYDKFGIFLSNQFKIKGIKYTNKPNNTLKVISFIPIYSISRTIFYVRLPWIIAYIMLLILIFYLFIRFGSVKLRKREVEKDLFRFKKLFDSANFGLAICKLDGEVVYLNDYFARSHGYSVREIIGKNLKIFHTEEQIKEVERINRDLIKNGYYNSIEVWHKRRDGSVFPMLMNGILMKDENGEPEYIAASAVDTSLYVETREALEKEKEAYRKLFEFSNDAVFIRKKGGIIVDVNMSACKLLGVSNKDEIIGKNIFDIYKGFLDLKLDLKSLGDGFLKSDNKRFEAIMNKFSDNSNIYVEVSLAVIERDKGIIQEVVRDVTEKKKIEKELIKANKKYESILNNLIDVYYRADMNNKLIYISPSVLNYYKADSVDELIGKDIADTFYFKPEDRKRFMDELMKNGKLILYPLVLKREDGNPIYIETNSQVVYNDNGEAIGIEGILRDVTSRVLMEKELKKQEENYREIFNSVSDAIAVLDARDLKIIDINSEFCNKLNYSRNELVGESFGRILIENGDFSFKEFKIKLKSEIESSNDEETIFEWYTVNREGNGVWCEIKAKKMMYNDIESIVIISRDITSRKEIEEERERYSKKLEEEVKRRTAELEKINEKLLSEIVRREQAEVERQQLQEQFLHAQKMEAVGRLAGGIAHDFNNILTVIMGNAEFLLMNIDKNSSPGTEINEILKAARRAANLTRQLLMFSRKQNMKIEDVNINNLIKNMEKMIIRLIGEDISLVTELDENVKAIKGDPGQIEQLIMNLVVNSRDAIDKDGEITIRTSGLEIPEDRVINGKRIKKGEYVCLSVKDNGSGIDDSIIEKIFDPFFTTKERGKGTGLGLSSVHGIVEKHGGWIEVESKQGVGTEFRIYFPTIAKEVSMDGNIVENVIEVHGKGERILFIEDNDDVRTFIKKILTQAGYRVVEAHTASEAKQIFELEKDIIDLVLSDVILPKGNGVELVESFVELKPDLKVILASGYTDQRIDITEIEKKGYKFIQKPFEINNLLMTIGKLLKDRTRIFDFTNIAN